MSLTRDPLTEHPAKFSPEIMDRLRRVLTIEQRRLGRSPWVLDPFAGVGRVHQLVPAGTTIGVELERRWADCHRRTMQGNVLGLPFADGTFDVVATSPCYGNRMADHHDAKDGSKRRTYRHAYGEELHPDNAGTLQWGPAYRAFHVAAWAEVVRCLRPGGLFALNVSDHIRDDRYRHVVAFHALALGRLGLEWEDDWPVYTGRMKHGENAEARADHEVVLTLRKPEATAVPEAPGTVILGTDGDGTRPPYCSIHLQPLPCCGLAA